jgi:hypothetical protein
LDEVYCGYRIALSCAEGWSARITHVRGTVAPFSATASAEEGDKICLSRARDLIDRYVEFLRVPLDE